MSNTIRIEMSISDYEKQRQAIQAYELLKRNSPVIQLFISGRHDYDSQMFIINPDQGLAMVSDELQKQIKVNSALRDHNYQLSEDLIKWRDLASKPNTEPPKKKRRWF